jgi:hypothetical protein
MGDLRLQMHANNATDAMVQGRGDQSAQLAQRVSDELEKLFNLSVARAGCPTR